MPRRNGTGPLGQGAISGRGMGICTGVNRAGRGIGLGLGLMAANRGLGNRALRHGTAMGWGLCRWMGNGFRGGFWADPGDDLSSAGTPKKLLEKEKTLLERKLNILNQRLKDLAEVDE
ncbi:MAG: DUF5320 domain-containing protein [Syntrophomonadaceae bacterium]|nr:DUF5320 domain-containing protein [Syntrophomonadaceae bacterium]